MLGNGAELTKVSVEAVTQVSVELGTMRFLKSSTQTEVREFNMTL